MAAQYACRRLSEASPKLLAKLAQDPVLRRAFWAKERERCSDPFTGFKYFMHWYASVPTEEGGERQIMRPWDWQWDLIEHLQNNENLIFLKPRGTGGTIVPTHYQLWLAAFNSASPRAKLSSISISATKAGEHLEEIKDMLHHLPPGLIKRNQYGQGAVKPDGQPARETQLVLEFARGSKIQCFAANGAIRGLTGRLVFWDEAAHPSGSHDQGNKIKAAAFAAVRRKGQIVVVSTAQGRSGPGAPFADLWDKAASGQLAWKAFFVSREQDPRFTEEWWEQQIVALGSALAKQEYPLTPEEAFEGNAEGAHLPSHHISAAVALGREWKLERELGTLPRPIAEKIDLGVDWGMNTAGVVIYPLANGDIYITRELSVFGQATESFTRDLIMTANPFTRDVNGNQIARIENLYYDSAGAQQALTMIPIVDELSPRTRCTPARFNKIRKTTVTYIRTLLEHTANENPAARIGIDPDCVELIRQMRDGQMAEDGDRKKGDDHTFDAMIAGLAQYAFEYNQAVALGSR